MVTTSRAISRVALVASTMGSRSQRESIVHDPMAWTLAPRMLFDGNNAVDACFRRDVSYLARRTRETDLLPASSHEARP